MEKPSIFWVPHLETISDGTPIEAGDPSYVLRPRRFTLPRAQRHPHRDLAFD